MCVWEGSRQRNMWVALDVKYDQPSGLAKRGKDARRVNLSKIAKPAHRHTHTHTHEIVRWMMGFVERIERWDIAWGTQTCRKPEKELLLVVLGQREIASDGQGCNAISFRVAPLQTFGVFLLLAVHNHDVNRCDYLLILGTFHYFLFF